MRPTPEPKPLPKPKQVGEWVLINKAVSPVMLPALLGLANVMANRRAAAAEGLAVTEGPPSGGAAKGLPSSPPSAAAARDLERGPRSLAGPPLSVGPSPSPPVPPVPPVPPAATAAAAAAAATAASPDAPTGALLRKEVERLERLYYSNAGQTPPHKSK